MRHAGKFLLALLIAGVATGCANESADFYAPEAQSECVSRVIDNEYLVKFHAKPAVERMNLDRANLRKLRESDDVAWVEPNYRVFDRRPPSSRVTPQEFGRPGAYVIGADYAWNRGIRGQGVIVAVVDSGVDVSHPWLQGQVLQGYNFVNNTPDFRDETGHGTHIAGVIASKQNPEFSGIAPDAKLVVGDFMEGDRGDEFNAIRAVDFSLKSGARVINNSWSNFCSFTIRKAFEDWQSLNVIFVNAAGNDALMIDALSIFPSNLNLPNNITVGSVNALGERSKFSNYGTNVTIYAPGEDVFSLPTKDIGSGFLVPRSGTSMATAFVSGAMALAISARPEATAADIVRELKAISSSQVSGKNPVIDIRKLLEGLEN